MNERVNPQSSSSFLSEMVTNISKMRLPFQARGENTDISTLCNALLDEHSEAGILHLASAVFLAYDKLEDDARAEFFSFLNDAYDLDHAESVKAATEYAADQSAQNYRALLRSTRSKRYSLFQRLNQVPGGTERLVAMRAALLRLLKTHPELARTDQDFLSLLRSWFNRGFLDLRNVTWDSPATLLEKIIAYEAVHKIHRWNDLRKRLAPDDRRCFAFFHPSMPDEPLIFVEVALTKGVPGSIDEILADDHVPLDADKIDTATFYSISNCQPGLASVSFGNSLIKQVVRNLSDEFPKIKNYVTLSPIPGLRKWTEENAVEADALDQDKQKAMAAHYLTKAKGRNDMPYDPVARFHLGNGAQVFRVHAGANKAPEAQDASFGVMVNYLYDLKTVPSNQIRFANEQFVTSSKEISTLSNQFSL